MCEYNNETHHFVQYTLIFQGFSKVQNETVCMKMSRTGDHRVK